MIPQLAALKTGQKILGAVLLLALWLAPAAAVGLYMAGKASREYERGKDEIQAAWDIDKAKARAEVEAAQKAAREKEERDRTAYEATINKLIEEKNDAQRQLLEDLADVRADNARLRVRDRLRCPATPGVSGAAAGAGGAEEAQAGLLPEDAEFLLRIGREADDVVRELNTCIETLEADRRR